MLNWPTPIPTHLSIIFRHMTYTKTWRTTWRRTISVDHPLHSKTNAKVRIKMKDECSSLAPQEFVGLRAKIYSFLLPNGKLKFTAKGVSRRYILKHLHQKDYHRTFKETESTIATFSTILSLKQQINTLEVTKKCRSAFDDKCYILNDGIATLAYGHYKISQMKST